MLVAPRVRMFGMTRDFDTLEVFAIACSIAPENDNDTTVVIARTPPPKCLMIGDRFGQTERWAKVIDRAGLTVAVCKNCRARLFFESDVKTRAVASAISRQPNSSAKYCGSGPVGWFSAFGGSKPSFF